MSRVKLIVSASVFIILTAIKLAAPDLADNMRRLVIPRLNMDYDYRKTMTDLGQMVTGEEGFIAVLSGIYKAASKPGTQAEATAFQESSADAHSPTPEPSPSLPKEMSLVSLSELRESLTKDYPRIDNTEKAPMESTEEDYGVQATDEKEIEPEAESDTEEAEDTDEDSAAVAAFIESQSSYDGYDIPANVLLHDVQLPFEYSIPVEGYNSSGFGYRLHPLDDDVKFHYGTDIAAYTGTNIAAFADGTVLMAGESESYGLYIILGHGDGYSTLYAHCNTVMVENGDSVLKGQTIAQVGTTGKVTGAHLHFELLKDGMYLNPEFYV